MLARCFSAIALGLLILAAGPASAAPALDAQATATAGSELTFTVSDVGNPRDFITIVPKSQQEGTFAAYVYAGKGGSLTLLTPPVAGDYELRLLNAGSPYATQTRRAIRLEAASATLDFPAQVASGAKFQVTWTGPKNARDFIGIGDARQKYGTYHYVREGSTLTFQAPDQPGTYQVRYFLASGETVIAEKPLTVTGVSASVSAPASVEAGSSFKVQWTGPNNAYDFVNLVPKGAREGESGVWAFTSKGNPAQMLAPLSAGEYELRYSLGQSHATLARTSIQIAPGKQEPGFVAVTPPVAASSDNAVEIIFDASGSMLQKIGGKRRIEIARETLTHLTSQIIPAGTPFAMRVFGREASSCRTDLFIPVSPLAPAAVAGEIARLDAKNGAKTPIGASLAKVAEDLGTVKGERLVVLLTDGEETCNGDPAAEIEKLQKSGLGVRVSIVGFAIDEPGIAVTFRQWAKAGNGAFFEANDAAGLSNALAQAMRPGFEVIDAQGQVVAEGVAGTDTVKVMPGNYTVRLKGQKTAPRPVTVKSKETAAVRF